ncbi:MAG TPA: polysaccharide deacetylase family protein [Chloroflexia bacterium]|nr:polysaccharide deacetylase family protein [Chloroflexia bacterium]
MDLQPFLTQYLPPMLATVIIVLALLLVLLWLASRGQGTRLWQGVVRYRGPLAFLFLVVLFAVAFMTFVLRTVGGQRPMVDDQASFATPTNLLYGAGFNHVPLTGTVYTADTPLSDTQPVGEGWQAELPAGSSLLGPVFSVRPGERYASWFGSGGEGARVQGRLVWFDAGLNVLSWDDGPVWMAGSEASHSSRGTAPASSAYVRLQIRNASEEASSAVLVVREPGLAAEGVYVEPHPYGAQASVAFSFDWETAMGGAIHSKGNDTHAPGSAAEHGLAMREGAEWLAGLFKRNGIKATFYGTGYNLLDGNTEKRKFNGDPTYEWASPDNGWATDYWLTHPWFSDDPFGTVESHPAWYFGDQTRRLLEDGHEIAPHTFAHIYVRGSNPEELANDLDTWIAVAGDAGVPKPSTFAFPWRSSNSLTKEFYDVLYERGIRAVTRIYPLDMKDLYVLGNAVVYTDVRQAQLYPDMAVMPDFLLGGAAYTADEEAGGAPVGLEQGLAVLREALSRRGTTSFWTHPEQLADDPPLAEVRASWEGVVRAAAEERDRGRLWIDTVEAITAYQRDVRGVTVALEDEPGPGPWLMRLQNDSGRELSGVTLTLPVDAAAVTSEGAAVRPVYRGECDGLDCRVTVGQATDQGFDSPARQIVLEGLRPGATTLQVEWAASGEPGR